MARPKVSRLTCYEGYGYLMLSAVALALTVFLILAATVVCDRRQRNAFNERFPPISDDEFMARCPAGTNPAIALKVRRIIAGQLGIEYERIYPESSFVDDLGV